MIFDSRGQAVAIFVALMFVAFLLVVLIAAVLFRRDSSRAQDRRVRMRSGRYGFSPMVGGADHPRPPKGPGPVGRGGYVMPGLPAPRVTVVCGGCGNEHLCGSQPVAPPVDVPRYERVRRVGGS